MPVVASLVDHQKSLSDTTEPHPTRDEENSERYPPKNPVLMETETGLGSPVLFDRFDLADQVSPGDVSEEL